MKNIFKLAFAVLLIAATAVNAESIAPTKVRIGWQIPWSTQGQLVQIWKHTDILAKYGIEAEFIGRTYGPQLNEAAMAGAVDVILTADQPAAALFSKDKGWVAIARLMYNRTSTYVPPSSKIKDVAGLKGQTIGVPVGAAAERITVAALKRSGLDSKKDVNIVNLGILEQPPLIQANEGKESFGQFAALSGFDPLPAILEAKGLVRNVDTGKVVSLVLADEKFLKGNAGLDKKLRNALIDAYDYYRSHVQEANGWFTAEAGLKDATDSALNIASSIEPNLKAKSRSQIRITLNDEDLKIMQEAADFLEPTLKKKVEMKSFVRH